MKYYLAVKNCQAFNCKLFFDTEAQLDEYMLTNMPKRLIELKTKTVFVTQEDGSEKEEEVDYSYVIQNKELLEHFYDNIDILAIDEGRCTKYRKLFIAQDYMPAA